MDIVGHQLKRWRFLGAVAVSAVSGLLVSAPVQAGGVNDELAEAERHAAAMIEAAKFTVIHMNRSASASSLAAAQGEARLAKTSGQEMVALGRKAIGKVEHVMLSAELPHDAYLRGEQAVCSLRESIRHTHHWLLHAHHIQMSDSFRGGVGHILDAARHARITGIHLITAQSYLTTFVQEVASLKLSESARVHKVKGLPHCGLGEESQHGREIFLDVDDEHEEHGKVSASQEKHH